MQSQFDVNIWFGKKVKSLRKNMGLSQLEFSNLVGIAQSHLGLIELGKKDIYLTTVFRIASAAGVSVSDMLDLREPLEAVYSDPDICRVAAYMSELQPEVRHDVADAVRFIKRSHEH